MVHVLKQRSPCSPWGDHGEGGASQQSMEAPTYGKSVRGKEFRAELLWSEHSPHSSSSRTSWGRGGKGLGNVVRLSLTGKKKKVGWWCWFSLSLFLIV